MVFLGQGAQSQVIDTLDMVPKQDLHDIFYAKHKKQKKVGLILLGSGLVAAGVGAIMIVNSDDLGNDFSSGTLLYSAGVIATISSIPVLIISGSNKRKAKAYIQAGEHRLIDWSLPDSKVVSVGFKIDL